MATENNKQISEWSVDELFAELEDLFNYFDNRGELVYLHVSGQRENISHSLIYEANNKKAIINFLGEIFSQTKKYPIILEGQYSNSAQIAEEIVFLKKELNI